jgi:hypothetical protein
MSVPPPPNTTGNPRTRAKHAAPFLAIATAAIAVYCWPSLNPPSGVITGGVLVWLTTRRPTT